MSDKYKDNVTVTGLFDGKFGGLTAKVTADMVEKLSQIKEGGYLNINIVSDEKREANAERRQVEIKNTVAAYLEFAPGKGGQGIAPEHKPSSGAPKEAPRKTSGRVTRFE